MALFRRDPAPPPQRFNGQPEVERIGIFGAPVYYNGRYTGTYRLVYQRAAQPSPGAMAYAYMSRGLPPVTIGGTGQRVGSAPSPYSPPQVRQPASFTTRGLPEGAGGLYGAPLITGG